MKKNVFYEKIKGIKLILSIVLLKNPNNVFFTSNYSNKLQVIIDDGDLF